MADLDGDHHDSFTEELLDSEYVKLELMDEVPSSHGSFDLGFDPDNINGCGVHQRFSDTSVVPSVVQLSTAAEANGELTSSVDSPEEQVPLDDELTLADESVSSEESDGDADRFFDEDEDVESESVADEDLYISNAGEVVQAEEPDDNAVLHRQCAVVVGSILQSPDIKPEDQPMSQTNRKKKSVGKRLQDKWHKTFGHPDNYDSESSALDSESEVEDSNATNTSGQLSLEPCSAIASVAPSCTTPEAVSIAKSVVVDAQKPPSSKASTVLKSLMQRHNAKSAASQSESTSTESVTDLIRCMATSAHSGLPMVRNPGAISNVVDALPLLQNYLHSSPQSIPYVAKSLMNALGCCAQTSEKIVLVKLLLCCVSENVAATKPALVQSGCVKAIYDMVHAYTAVEIYSVVNATRIGGSQLFELCLHLLLAITTDCPSAQQQVGAIPKDAFVSLLIRLNNPLYGFLSLFEDAMLQKARLINNTSYRATLELANRKEANFWLSRAVKNVVSTCNVLVCSAEILPLSKNSDQTQPSIPVKTLNEELIQQNKIWKKGFLVDTLITQRQKLHKPHDEEMFRKNKVVLECNIAGVVNSCLLWLRCSRRDWVLKIVNEVLDSVKLQSLSEAPRLSQMVTCSSDAVAQAQTGAAVFCRAVVTELIDNDRVGLFVFDYGATKIAAWKELFICPEEIAKVPSALVLAVLKDSVPVPDMKRLNLCLEILQAITKGHYTMSEAVCRNGGITILTKFVKLYKTKSHQHLSFAALRILLNLSAAYRNRSFIASTDLIPILIDLAGELLSTLNEEEKTLRLILKCLSNLCSDCLAGRKEFENSRGLVLLTYLTKPGVINPSSSLAKVVFMLSKSVMSNKLTLDQLDQTEKNYSTDMVPLNGVAGPSAAERFLKHIQRKSQGKHVEIPLSDNMLQEHKMKPLKAGDSLNLSQLLTTHPHYAATLDILKAVSVVPTTQKHYFKGETVKCTKHRNGVEVVQEFWHLTDLKNLSRSPLQRLLCGILNTHKFGIVYFGVNKHGIVEGHDLNPDRRDELRLGVDGVMTRGLRPSLDPGSWSLDFVPVYDRQSRAHIGDKYVVELSVEQMSYQVFSLFDGQVYIRRDGETVICNVAEMRGFYAKTFEQDCEKQRDELHTEILILKGIVDAE